MPIMSRNLSHANKLNINSINISFTLKNYTYGNKIRKDWHLLNIDIKSQCLFKNIHDNHYNKSTIFRKMFKEFLMNIDEQFIIYIVIKFKCTRPTQIMYDKKLKLFHFKAIKSYLHVLNTIKSLELRKSYVS